MFLTHPSFYINYTIIKKLFMKEKGIGLKKKKLNTESFFKSLETNSKIRRILYLIKCLESCPTLLKPEIIINVEVIIKKWRDKDLRSTAF